MNNGDLVTKSTGAQVILAAQLDQIAPNILFIYLFIQFINQQWHRSTSNDQWWSPRGSCLASRPPRGSFPACLASALPRQLSASARPCLGFSASVSARPHQLCFGLGSASNFLPRSYSGLIVLGLATNCWVWWCWQNKIKIWIFRQSETLTLNLLTFCVACVCEGEGEHSVLT